MTHQTIVVPDIGGAEGAEVVELLVAVGDAIELEQSLLFLSQIRPPWKFPHRMLGLLSS
jgi:pyruvate dehydrogenase E2 component (dihydrolipoamide acetyltransferase)